MSQPGKRRLRNFLLDPRFQLKYASLIALTGGLVFGVMGGLFYSQVRVSSELTAIDETRVQPVAVPAANSDPTPNEGAPSGVVIEAELIEPVGDLPPPVEPTPTDGGFEAELAAQLAEDDASLMWTLVGSWVVLVLMLFVLGILVTHRIVGPLYVVDRNLARLMAGEPVRPRPLRRGDEFVALFERVAALGLRWETARTEEKALIEEAIDALRSKIEAAGDEPVEPAAVAGWVDEALAPLMELAASKA